METTLDWRKKQLWKKFEAHWLGENPACVRRLGEQRSMYGEVGLRLGRSTRL